MATSIRTRFRTTLAAGAIIVTAGLGALLPTAALGLDTSSDQATASERAGATALGGWVGGGILLLGVGVMTASASVRRQRREALGAES